MFFQDWVTETTILWPVHGKILYLQGGLQHHCCTLCCKTNKKHAVRACRGGEAPGREVNEGALGLGCATSQGRRVIKETRLDIEKGDLGLAQVLYLSISTTLCFLLHYIHFAAVATLILHTNHLINFYKMLCYYRSKALFTHRCCQVCGCSGWSYTGSNGSSPVTMTLSCRPAAEPLLTCLMSVTPAASICMIPRSELNLSLCICVVLELKAALWSVGHAEEVWVLTGVYVSPTGSDSPVHLQCFWSVYYSEFFLEVKKRISTVKHEPDILPDRWDENRKLIFEVIWRKSGRFLT